jgi:hypothetical protein
MVEIETDEFSSVVLPGYPNQRFLVQENSDGSLLLKPLVDRAHEEHPLFKLFIQTD